MQLQPGQQDREPRQTRYWVNNIEGGMTTVTVSESEMDVEVRLREEFPMYRLKKVGEGALSKLRGLHG